MPATGNGKARRYPRETAQSLHALRIRGRSIKTSNLYLDALKQFAVWLVQDRRTGENPLVHLSGGNVKLDRRHDRRPLPLDELRRVFAAARRSERPFLGLSGPDRAVLYSVACASGFRADELASLHPSAFDLDGEPPTVTLAAEDAKNGQTAVQPLPPDVVSALRGYLAGRPEGQPVWPGRWHKKAAEMLRIDLESAGIPYAVEGPDGPLYADFHALRHSYIKLLDKSGATLKEAMQLARHSDPKLTMAVYGRAQLHDLGEAVRRLPALLGDDGEDRAALQATGTEGMPPESLRSACASNDLLCDSVRGIERVEGLEGEADTNRKPLVLQGFESGCEAVIGSEESSPRGPLFGAP
jgi:integrase